MVADLCACFRRFRFFGCAAAPEVRFAQAIVDPVASRGQHRQIPINPYALSARVNGLSIKAEGGKEVAGFDELFINVSAASIFKLAAVIDEIRLQGLRVVVARVAEGRYDISRPARRSG